MIEQCDSTLFSKGNTVLTWYSYVLPIGEKQLTSRLVYTYAVLVQLMGK